MTGDILRILLLVLQLGFVALLYLVLMRFAGSLLRVQLKAGHPVTADKTVLAVLEPSDPAFLNARELAEAEARVKAAEAAVQQTGSRVAAARQEYELATGLLARVRKAHEGVSVLAHPECPPDVLAAADYVGSTAGMVGHLEKARPSRVVLVTECSMSDNVAVHFPETEFVRPCNLCPHMKRITLPGILRSLQTLEHRVEVDPAVGERARRAVERMLAVGRGAGR